MKCLGFVIAALLVGACYGYLARVPSAYVHGVKWEITDDSISTDKLGHRNIDKTPRYGQQIPVSFVRMHQAPTTYVRKQPIAPVLHQKLPDTSVFKSQTFAPSVYRKEVGRIGKKHPAHRYPHHPHVPYRKTYHTPSHYRGRHPVHRH